MYRRSVSIAMSLGTCLLLAGCAGKMHEVVKASNATAETDGTPYWLPRNVVEVAVPFTRIDTSPSIFEVPGHANTVARGLAEKLGLEYGDEATKKIDVGVPVITTVSEADPDAAFIVKSSRRRLENQKLMLELSQLGVITSASSEVENRTSDFIVSVAKTAASIAGAVAGVNAAAPVEAVEGAADAAGGPGPNFAAEDLGKKARESKKDAALAEAEAKARDYFTRIENIRAKRAKLVSGEVEVSSKEALELMLDELDEEEAKYAGAFTGKEKTIPWTATFEIRLCKSEVTCGDKPCPDVIELCKPLLTTTSDKITVGETVKQSPPAGFLEGWTAKDCNTVALKLAYDKKQPVNAIPSETRLLSDGDRSFYYRIPAIAKAEVKLQEETLASGTIQVAQWGATASLPRTTLGRKTKVDLTWYESVGALKKLQSESTAQNPEQIEQIGSALAPLLQKSPDTPEVNQLEQLNKQLLLLLQSRDLGNALRHGTEIPGWAAGGGEE